MYCNQCGKKLPDNAKFCNFCGSAVSTEQSGAVADPPRSDDPAVTAKAKGPKRRLSPLLKILLAILGGAAVVILAIMLISGAVEEKKRTTILGTIPDPETFFGVSGDHYRYDSWYEHNIEFETEDVTKDMTDAYVDLLGSSEFPFVLNDTIDHFGGGMVRYVFEYNGSQELYDAKSWQIMVEYNPGHEQVAVEIRNSGNFRLVPVEPYASDSVSEESMESTYVPDPEFFFNTGAAEKGDNSMTLVLSGTPGVAVFEYISVLKDSCGMTEIDSYTEAENWQWRLQKGGNENATVSIALDKRGDGDWDVSFLFGDSVTLVQAETWSGGDGIPDSEPAPTPEPTPEPTPAPDDPSVIPDFLAHDSSGSFYQRTTSSDNVVGFLSEEDSVRYVTEDYVQLLLDMGYYISDTEEKSNQFMDVYRWYLTHDDVGGSTVEGSAQVFVKHMLHIPYKSDDPYTTVSITFGSGVTYEGDSQTGSGSGSGGSGSGSSSARTPCSICNRTGDCQTCGGDGYLWSSASDKEDRNCYKCRNHNGKCTNCNGAGWLD